MRKLFLIIALAMAFTSFAQQQQSIFSEGTWYRFSTDFSQPSQSVIKVTYEKLANSGIDLEVVNPDKLQLFIMPPGLLSEEVSNDNFNPLKEMPVKLYGCEDGSFDAGDYLLFYPASQQRWGFHTEEEYYLGTFHPYTDEVHYFLRTDAESDGLRVGEIAFLEEQPDTVLQHSQRILGGPVAGGLNPANVGAEFVQQEITNEDFTYEVSDEMIAWPEAKTVFGIVTGSTESSQLRLLKNGSEVATFDVPGSAPQIFEEHIYAYDGISVATGDVFTVEFPESSGENQAAVYLKDFSIQAVTEIASSGLLFNSAQPSDEVTEWDGSWSPDTEVWNLTNIYAIAQQQTNNENIFRTNSNVREKFIAFNPQTNEGVEVFGGTLVTVDFEDLYVMSTPDMLVITNENLTAEASNYAAIHENEGLSVEVVDIQSVYNNFSGGITDYTAVRNFMAHHYNKSGGQLSYLTIYGDASVYTDDERSIVPTYQTTEVWGEYMLEAGDRYFGYLDNGEDFTSSESDMDIAVGRIPVATGEEAAMVNQKLLNYSQQGDWQLSMTLSADDEDMHVYMNLQEDVYAMIDELAKVMNIHKVYLDSYEQGTQGEQQVSPEAQEAMVESFERGDVLIDYMGHGGHSQWAHEQVLDSNVVKDLSNSQFPFVLFTVKQDFFHPDSPSLSEQLLLQQHGAIAGLSSAHSSFAQTWNQFRTFFYQAVFEEGISTHGLAMKYAINQPGNATVKSYCLIGDPALRFPFPEYQVLTKTVNDITVEEIDTLYVGEPYTLNASVYDDSGVVGGFDGEALVKVFAPAHQQVTLGTDEEPFSYMVSDSLLSEQTVQVNNGNFEATFSLPSNYDFSPDEIKVSYYAQSQNRSAAGYENLFSVSEPSGIDDGENVQFKVYPTITDSDVMIQIGMANSDGNGYLEVMNLQGVCLYRKRINNSTNSRINLSLTDYPPGMYLIRLLGENYGKMVKIIKQ